MTNETKSQPVITPRARELPEGAGIPFDAQRLARDLLRSARSCVLSTLDPKSGYPFGSVTNLATDHGGTPIFFAAMLAAHSRNILADSRVALTIAALGRGDALAEPRLSLVGRAAIMEGDLGLVQRRYINRHPKGKLYLSLPDARMFRVTIEGVHLGAGPGRNAAEVIPADLATDIRGADELIAAEEAELTALNGRPDLVARLAQAAHLTAGRWRATGIDPDGIDLIDGDASGRFTFETRICHAADLSAVLASL